MRSVIDFVPSTDLERSRAFYEGVLGLEVEEISPYALVLRSGGTMIRVAQVQELTRPVPGVGTLPTPAAVLIRPDGYVAWVSDRELDIAALHQAFKTWCGPASNHA